MDIETSGVNIEASRLNIESVLIFLYGVLFGAGAALIAMSTILLIYF